jgi:RNA polymerase sigma-70 factor (sigma-E family)
MTIAVPARASLRRRFADWLLMAVDAVAAAVITTDRDALVAELFRLEGARLVRMARLFTDDRNAAEDLVQEAFIRLHRAAHRIQDPAKAAPYLRSIVVNLARDHNRRGLMSLRHQEAEPSGTEPDVPEDVLVLDDERRRLLEEVRELSPRQRDCILLRFYLDLSESEIAETLDISKNSVKTHCRRGMEALRARIGVTT